MNLKELRVGFAFCGSFCTMDRALNADAPKPSLVDAASTRGLPLRRWALAAMVTAVSVMPWASLPRVLPVQGHTTIAPPSAICKRLWTNATKFAFCP